MRSAAIPGKVGNGAENRPRRTSWQWGLAFDFEHIEDVVCSARRSPPRVASCSPRPASSASKASCRSAPAPSTRAGRAAIGSRPRTRISSGRDRPMIRITITAEAFAAVSARCRSSLSPSSHHLDQVGGREPPSEADGCACSWLDESQRAANVRKAQADSRQRPMLRARRTVLRLRGPIRR